MRRILAFALSALLLAGAWVLEPPPSRDPDVATVTTEAEEPSTSSSRFAHCGWAYADGDIDTVFALATLADAEYRLSFPAGGEMESLDPEQLPPRAGVGVLLSNIRVQGDAPAVVEFSDGPAAAAVVAQGDTELAAATCPSSIPKIWLLPAGTTNNDVRYVLRLLNPFADDARVSIRATSELGSEAVPGLDSLSIPARALRTILLHEELPGRSTLSLSIEQSEGSVIPMAEISNGVDIAVWPGVRPSETWEVPVTTLPGMVGDLVLSNDALIEVNYSIDIFGFDGSVTAGPSGTLPGPGTERLPLEELTGGDQVGVVVSADGPIATAVTFSGIDGGLAVAPGLPTVSAKWLVPGPNADPAARYRLWVLNSGVDDASVQITFLDPVGDSGVAQQTVVPATSVAAIPVTDAGSAGLLVEASGPISVLYTATVGDSVAVGEAVPVGD